MAPKISIVIPSWRDAPNVAKALGDLSSLARLHEIIIVDASSDPAIAALAASRGAKVLRCATPSRGLQMNLGATEATGDILVFQHADTEFRADHFRALEEAMQDKENIGGAFYRQFDERHPRLRRWEWVARYLTRNGGTLFGDQTVFVRRDVFARLGGFAQIPLMEDVEFSRRLRAAGRVVILDPPVRTSARNHATRGAWRTTIQNGLFLLLFKLGVSPQRLHARYYRG